MISPLPPPIPPPAPAPPQPPGRTGRLVAGLLLVLLGAGWLFEVLDIGEFPWDVVLPASLIVIGGVLVLRSRGGESQRGLVTFGIVLTVLLVIGSAVDFPMGGGVGERHERPASVTALEAEYRLGVGELTLDLTELAGTAQSPAQRVRARVGIGELTVIVPQGTPVRVEAHVGLGEVQIFDVEGSGFDVSRQTSPQSGEPVFELVLSVGLGQVDVRRG